MSRKPKRKPMSAGLTMAKTRRHGGRHHRRVAIPDGLEREGRHLSGKREIVHVSMDDPNPLLIQPVGEPRRQQMVAKNGRVSPLEYEYATRRISEAAYLMGRRIERALEITSPGSGGQWRDGDRVDAASAHEHAIAVALDEAKAANGLLDWMRGYLGTRTVKIVEYVIRDMMLFRDVARLLGWKDNQRKTADVAVAFRDALETLAEKSAAKGRRQ